MAFVDLEEVFDQVPRKFIWWRLRKRCVEDWIVRLVHRMYSRLSLSQIPRDSLKYFEISVLRHIRFAELGGKLIRLTKFNKYMCNWTLEVRFLIVLGFNDTSTLVGHFVSSPREREKRDRRDSRGDERDD